MPRRNMSDMISLKFNFFDDSLTESGIKKPPVMNTFFPLSLPLLIRTTHLTLLNYHYGYLINLIILCCSRGSSFLEIPLGKLAMYMNLRNETVWKDLIKLEKDGIISGLRRGESVLSTKEERRREKNIKKKTEPPSEQAPPRIPDGIPMISETDCVINPEIGPEKKTTCQTPDAIVELWNREAHPSLKRIHSLNPKRRKRLSVLLKQNNSLEFWRSQLKAIEREPFYIGQGSKFWLADIDWFITEKAQAKLLDLANSPSGMYPASPLGSGRPPQQMIVEGEFSSPNNESKKQADKDRLDELKRKMNDKPNEPEEPDHEF